MEKIKKTIEYALYFLIFLLPWQTRLILSAGEINGGYFEYGTISLYAFDLFLMFILCAVLFLKSKENKINLDKKLNADWYILATLEFVVFVSVLFAPDFGLAFYGYLRFLLGLSLFWLISNSNFKRINFYYAFWISLVLQSVLGLWQFIAQKTFASKWLGLAKHSPIDLGVSVVETVGGQRWLRVYGGQDHPNIFGAYLAVALILLALTFLSKKVKSKLEFILLSLFTVLFSINLFLSFSRAAWLSLFLSLIFLFGNNILRKDYKIAKKVSVFIVLILIIFSSLSFYYKDLLLTRISQEGRLEQKSTDERIDSILVSREIIAKNFFVGTGINNYPLAVKKDLYPDKESWFYQPVHNLYLLVTAELGVLGGALFMFFLLNLFFKNLFFKNKNNYTSLIILIFFSGLFDHWWWSLHSGVILFWFLVAIIEKEE